MEDVKTKLHITFKPKIQIFDYMNRVLAIENASENNAWLHQ